MSTPRKTKEEKIAILREAEQKGIVATCDKYGIYPATYYTWKNKFDQMGEAEASAAKKLRMASKTAKIGGVILGALVTSYSWYKVNNQANNNQEIDKWDLADAIIGTLAVIATIILLVASTFALPLLLVGAAVFVAAVGTIWSIISLARDVKNYKYE